MACKYPQKRNWKTGRCKTPCARHQAVNPATGRCVSKSYLRSLHWYDYDEEEGLEDLYGYGYNLLGEELDDLADGLVADSSCKPPTKLNLLTGKCKTPCGPFKVINPETGQCVTKKHMRSLNYNLYDADLDDYMLADRLFFPYMSHIDLIARKFGNDYLTELNKLTGLTDNDMVVMFSIRNSIDNSTSYFGQNKPALVGIYDRILRKKCENFSIVKAMTDKLGECGVTSVKNVNSTALAGQKKSREEVMKEALLEAGKKSNTYAFFCQGGLRQLDIGLINIMKEVAKSGSDAKVLHVCDQGVWKIIIPKNEDVQIQLIPDKPTEAEIAKNITEVYGGKLIVGFYDFSKLKKQS